jgi:hypothetical protein
MILQNIDELEENNYPVLIIGSGPAGLTLALELEKKNIKTVIIEAGGEEYNEKSQSFYKINTKDVALKDISNSRLRQFGGTSSIWGGWCKPLSDLDFKNFGLNLNQIKKYQKKACEVLSIENSFRESVINEDFNQIEFQYSKVSFYEKYFNQIKKSKNIKLILNTQLSHFDGKNNRIENAICISNKKLSKIKVKKFILCCGGIENSRILLWSQIQNKNLFDKDLKIGKFWMTHYWILGGIGFINLKKFKSYMKNHFINKDGPIHISANENNLDKKLQSSLYLSTNEDQNFIKEMVKSIFCIAPEYGKKVSKLILNKSLKCGNIFMHVEEAPIEQNEIILDMNNKDENGIPIAKINYKSSINAKKSAKNLVEKLAIFFRKNDLGRVALVDELHQLKEFENLGNYHHLGGTRIGNNSKNSVVDNNLKVHGIDNLYISGSSTFNKGTYKNPTFSIIQLSLKLADDLKNKLS